MSQTTKTLIALRELILNGEIAPGERLLEIALVEQLGVSRTPIRAALAKLAEEGLLEKTNNGGYTLRSFTEFDIRDAIEARGMIEGMAARLAAERGVTALALSQMKNCVTEIDALLDNFDLGSNGIEAYFELNDLFHRQLILLSNSFVVERTLNHITNLPFASPNAFTLAQSEMDESWKIFFVAQEHHRGIVEAIEHREGQRAESLAREHARLSLQTLRRILGQQSTLVQMPGGKLILNSFTKR